MYLGLKHDGILTSTVTFTESKQGGCELLKGPVALLKNSPNRMLWLRNTTIRISKPQTRAPASAAGTVGAIGASIGIYFIKRHDAS
ncbi:MAG: hypothetical protein CMJ20_02880 [Phycisphaeraceae bacterium]|nr:hypothetical protein [Phycisphaeraceae bacterium]